MTDEHRDRCRGCLLGTVCGDVLGAPVEGWPASEIRRVFGRIRDFVDSPRGLGRYTDDSEMTLALAVSLCRMGRLDAGNAAQTCAAFYHPWRGYGGGAAQVLQALRAGADFRRTGRSQFADGSYGNGGAMRIAPVGLAFRNASDEALHDAVEAALLCTHVHPEGIDGAWIQAKAVALLSQTPTSGFNPGELLSLLRQRSRTDALRKRLEMLEAALRHGASDEVVIDQVGNGIRASEAVAAALWALVRHGGEPEECLIRAVGFGGDADTIGALTGALLGARHGMSWIPARWFDRIENGDRGRDFFLEVADRLAALDLKAN